MSITKSGVVKPLINIADEENQNNDANGDVEKLSHMIDEIHKRNQVERTVTQKEQLANMIDEIQRQEKEEIEYLQNQEKDRILTQTLGKYELYIIISS